MINPCGIQDKIAQSDTLVTFAGGWVGGIIGTQTDCRDIRYDEVRQSQTDESEFMSNSKGFDALRPASVLP